MRQESSVSEAVGVVRTLGSLDEVVRDDNEEEGTSDVIDLTVQMVDDVVDVINDGNDDGAARLFAANAPPPASEVAPPRVQGGWRKVVVQSPSSPHTTASQLFEAFQVAKAFLVAEGTWDRLSWLQPDDVYAVATHGDDVLEAAGRAAHGQLSRLMVRHSRYGMQPSQQRSINQARMQLASAYEAWSKRDGRIPSQRAFCQRIGLQRYEQLSAATRFLNIARLTPGNAWPLLQISREALHSQSKGWPAAERAYENYVHFLGVVYATL